MFDVNSEHRFKEIFSKRDFFLEDDGVYMGWCSDFDEKKGECEFNLTLFVKDGDGRFTKYEETQVEKLWTDAELSSMIKESGLEIVSVFSGFDMKEAKIEDEKRFYVVRCPQNK